MKSRIKGKEQVDKNPHTPYPAKAPRGGDEVAASPRRSCLCSRTPGGRSAGGDRGSDSPKTESSSRRGCDSRAPPPKPPPELEAPPRSSDPGVRVIVQPLWRRAAKHQMGQLIIEHATDRKLYDVVGAHAFFVNTFSVNTCSFSSSLEIGRGLH